jgi:hypothetical protein
MDKNTAGLPAKVPDLACVREHDLSGERAQAVEGYPQMTPPFRSPARAEAQTWPGRIVANSRVCPPRSRSCVLVSIG